MLRTLKLFPSDIKTIQTIPEVSKHSIYPKLVNNYPITFHLSMFKEKRYGSRDNIFYVHFRHMLANSLELQDMMDLYLKQGITAIDVVSEY